MIWGFSFHFVLHICSPIVLRLKPGCVKVCVLCMAQLPASANSRQPAPHPLGFRLPGGLPGAFFFVSQVCPSLAYVPLSSLFCGNLVSLEHLSGFVILFGYLFASFLIAPPQQLVSPLRTVMLPVLPAVYSRFLACSVCWINICRYPFLCICKWHIYSSVAFYGVMESCSVPQLALFT